MPNFNKVNLMGHIVRDLELKYLASGTAVVNITLAVSDGFGDKKTTAFIPAVVWGKTAEFASEHCKKGDCIMISGAIRQENWEKDGVKRSQLKVNCDQLVLVSKKKTETFDEIPD